MQNLHSENYNTLLKLKEPSVNGKTSPYQNPTAAFVQIEKLILAFTWSYKGPRKATANLKEKSEVERLILPKLRLTAKRQ